jgi:hypothetical protein
MNEDVYIIVMCICCFIIGAYFREKLEYFVKKEKDKGER